MHRETVKVLVCADRQDSHLVNEMMGHLALLEYQGLIELLDDSSLPAGKDADAERTALVEQAGVVLLMISPALMRTLTRNVMIQQALARYVQGDMLLIPIVLRPTDWKEYSFGRLVALPRDGRAVSQWSDRDVVWTAIARELRATLPRAAKGSPAGGRSDIANSEATSKRLSQGRFPQGHALIIGVGGPGIEVTERDARAVHAVLTDPKRGGYPAAQATLISGGEATRRRILEELETLAARINQTPDLDATALIYFSGHGMRTAEKRPVDYLVPRDYRPGMEAVTAISGAEFADRLAAIRSRRLIVFLDCCHAAGVPRGTASAIPADLEKQLGQGTGLVIISSSRSSEYSWLEPGAPLSIFTACLLEALQGKGSSDGHVRVLNVMGYLMQEVPSRHSNQHPIVLKILDLGENFPICYHGQAGEQPNLVADTKAFLARKLTDPLRRRLEEELARLQETESLYAERLRMLRRERAIAADAQTQFQMEQQIIEVEKMIAEYQKKIDALAG